MHDRDWPIAYDFIAIQAPGPYCMGVGSKDSVPAGFPKKNSGLAPEGLSILAGTGAGHRPLWCPTMALKIKIPGGSKGAPPWRFFPRSYSISLGQMRKHLRGPGQATYDFDGVRPGLLVVKTGGGHQAKPYYHLRVFIRSCHKAHAVLWHLLSLCGERRQRRRIICRFSHHENRRQRYHLNHPIQIGAAALGL